MKIAFLSASAAMKHKAVMQRAYEHAADALASAAGGFKSKLHMWRDLSKGLSAPDAGA